MDTLAGSEGLPQFTERLNRLMSTCLITDENGSRNWTKDSLAEAMSGVGGPISVGYLRRLLSGAQTNPTGRVLAGLSLVFDAPAAYWFDAQVANDHNIVIDARRREFEIGTI